MSSTRSAMMEKIGLQVGQGLGKDNQGATDHVKVARKDDVLGIGYSAAVHGTWSAQSVGFASVLARVNRGASSPVSSPTTSGVCDLPQGGAAQRVYAKRSRLKTGALTDEEGKREVLGAAGLPPMVSPAVLTGDCNLRSLTLRRMSVRSTHHEAIQPTPDSDNALSFVVSFPDPKPAKAAVTPFHNPV